MFNRQHVIHIEYGVIVVGRFDFAGDGMDIPYNTLLTTPADLLSHKKGWIYRLTNAYVK